MKPLPVQNNQMNKTEARYAENVLQPMLWAKEILDYRFEAIKFKLAPKTYYTPDFFVVYPGHFQVIEIKGGFARDDALVKFKTAREMFPWFSWRMMAFIRKEWQEMNI